MEGDSFQQWKSQCLTKNDFSRKGSVDEEISHIVAFINSQDQYFTTSSCSGRIVLFDGVSDCLEQQKQNCCWLFVTHQPCHKDDVIGGLEKSVGDATLKFEPFILHVQCKQLEDAQLLHTAAINAGFRNSGVTVGKKGKIIMAVRSSHCLEVPLTHKGKVLVTDEYLQYLVGVANQKMGENLRRISRFYDCLRGALQALEDPEEPEHKPIYRRRRKRYQAESLTDGCHNDRKKEEQEENSEDEVDCGSLFSEET